MSGLKVGDLVRLKSGGPRMVVDAVRHTDLVRTVWFDDAATGLTTEHSWGCVNANEWHPDTLVKIETES